MYTHILNWSTQSALILCSFVFFILQIEKYYTEKQYIISKNINEYLKKGKCHDLKQNDPPPHCITPFNIWSSVERIIWKGL